MSKYYNPSQEELQEKYTYNGKYYGPTQEDIDDWRSELAELHPEWTPSEKHPEFGYDYSPRDGYSVIHFPTGKVYSLFEGISYGGRSSSDIVFVLDSSTLYAEFVTFCYGANPIDIEGIIDWIADVVK